MFLVSLVVNIPGCAGVYLTPRAAAAAMAAESRPPRAKITTGKANRAEAKATSLASSGGVSTSPAGASNHMTLTMRR